MKDQIITKRTIVNACVQLRDIINISTWYVISETGYCRSKLLYCFIHSQEMIISVKVVNFRHDLTSFLFQQEIQEIDKHNQKFS